jgi:integrase
VFMANMKFTARGIASLESPKSGRTEYWDESMAGFGLRVSSSGVKTWMTMYRHKGRKRRHTLGTFPSMTLADAYEKARISLNEAANGKDPAGVKRSERISDTFGELAHEYLERHAKLKKKSWKHDEYILNRELLPVWKNMKASEVVRRDVLKVLDANVERGAPIQANRVLALVRKIYNFGIARDIVAHNPCVAVPMPSKPKSRDRVLSAEEIRKVWHSASQDHPNIAAMLKLRLLTAQRGGEIQSMRWEDIDLDSENWNIPAELSKNGLAHRVPLSKQALEILEPLQLERGESTHVFPSPVGAKAHIENIQKAIQRVRDRKGCGVEFVGHDLRRTAASYMASLGVPRLVISKILNHVESGVTAIYDRHGYDTEKREALQRWADCLAEVLHKSKEVKVVPLAGVKKREPREASFG